MKIITKITKCRPKIQVSSRCSGKEDGMKNKTAKKERCRRVEEEREDGDNNEKENDRKKQ